MNPQRCEISTNFEEKFPYIFFYSELLLREIFIFNNFLIVLKIVRKFLKGSIEI